MPAKKCEILMQKCEIVLNAIFSTNRPANTSFHACGMQDLTRTRPSRLSFMEKKTHKVPWDLQSVSLYDGRRGTLNQDLAGRDHLARRRR